jgi:hypothetical protein
MSLINHFRLADDMISHLNSVVYSVNDPFVESRYVGFVAVAAVTVYELCIKEIFCDFALRKHKVFGVFVDNYFSRINGRISLKSIKDEYLKKFGNKYVKRFKARSKDADDRCLQEYGKSMLASYGNIVVWRNQFAHEGSLPTTATYREVTKSYEMGKNVIIVLNDILTL